MKTLVKPQLEADEQEVLYEALCSEYDCYGIYEGSCETNRCYGIHCGCDSRCTFDWFSDDQNSSELIF